MPVDDETDGGDSQPRTVEPLSEAEAAWLEDQRGLMLHLLEDLEIDLSEDASVLDGAEALVQWWQSASEEDRIDANIVVCIAGVALGDCLADNFSLEWAIIQDGKESELGLVHAGSGFVITPMADAAARFATAEPGMVAELFESLCAAVEDALGNPPTNPA